jgi:ATP-dependent Clp protease ATP-binding subunit ClpC
MRRHTLFQFDHDARKVLEFAQKEAQRRQHQQIESEHLLLALVSETNSTAGRILEHLGIDRVQVEAVLQEKAFPAQNAVSQRLDLSLSVKRIIELAVLEAQKRGHPSIGTEHLLMGLVRLADEGRTDLLKDLNIVLDSMRQHLEQVLSETTEVSIEERIKQRLLEAEKPIGSMTIDELRTLFDEAVTLEELTLDSLARRRLFANIIAELLD